MQIRTRAQRLTGSQENPDPRKPVLHLHLLWKKQGAEIKDIYSGFDCFCDIFFPFKEFCFYLFVCLFAFLVQPKPKDSLVLVTMPCFLRGSLSLLWCVKVLWNCELLDDTCKVFHGSSQLWQIILLPCCCLF